VLSLFLRKKYISQSLPSVSIFSVPGGLKRIGANCRQDLCAKTVSALGGVELYLLKRAPTIQLLAPSLCPRDSFPPPGAWQGFQPNPSLELSPFAKKQVLNP
jgi:hypothetical protein